MIGIRHLQDPLLQVLASTQHLHRGADHDQHLEALCDTANSSGESHGDIQTQTRARAVRLNIPGVIKFQVKTVQYDLKIKCIGCNQQCDFSNNTILTLFLKGLMATDLQ